jgi:hypothetical protein
VSGIVSRVYQPNAAMCCEACVFGRGEHAAWCTAPRWISHGELAQMSGDDLERFRREFFVITQDPLTQRVLVEPRADLILPEHDPFVDCAFGRPPRGPICREEGCARYAVDFDTQRCAEHAKRFYAGAA